MRIFITGASGYIGKAVAKAFRAKGHSVSGLVRSQEHANSLILDEIWPVIGDMNEPNSYRKALEDADVCVHCASEYSEKGVELDAKTIDQVLDVFSKSSKTKTFIYTSGVWVYGSTGDRVVDESTPLNPPDLVKWRPKHEEKVLNATKQNLRTVVLRPGCVYGKVGSLTALLFNSTLNGSVQIIGDGSNRWAMIHVQDLAYAYVSVVEKELSRIVLDVVDDSRLTVREMAEAIAKSAGIPGKIQSISEEDAKKQFGSLVQGLTLSQQVSNAKIKQTIGWKVHHFPFTQEIDVYYQAWKSSQQPIVF